MLLAKVYQSMSPVQISATTKRSDNGLGAKVIQWVGKETSRWATTFDLLDGDGRPLAFTAIEFADELPEDESVEIASVIDKKGCRWVMAQIAMMTRIRALFLNHNERSILAQASRAAKQLATTGADTWDKKPRDWTNYEDAVLLKRLVEYGMTDNLMRATTAFKSQGLPVRRSA